VFIAALPVNAKCLFDFQNATNTVRLVVQPLGLECVTVSAVLATLSQQIKFALVSSILLLPAEILKPLTDT
jgi:hypothetical protein